MKTHVILTTILAIGCVTGCGASAPSAQTLHTAQRATRIGLEIGACVHLVVEQKLSTEHATDAIISCVEGAVSRDLASQQAVASATPTEVADGTPAQE